MRERLALCDCSLNATNSIFFTFCTPISDCTPTRDHPVTQKGWSFAAGTTVYTKFHWTSREESTVKGQYSQVVRGICPANAATPTGPLPVHLVPSRINGHLPVLYPYKLSFPFYSASLLLNNSPNPGVEKPYCSQRAILLYITVNEETYLIMRQPNRSFQ